ncbi:MFS transporter [Pararhodobacter marinus]|uniref:MFS transporter n=1 Tax=Pararhodobacter marinus TaxID=2184063 RepID=A0A2U2CJ09_9RHOB|nr:MFS transporter [Pararhodobacter marinus]PWE31852.1 MFS transporter [Pararhodobacter marinus]
MLSALANPVYRRLFTAQIVALLGTGLLTVALGLLAHDLAGAEAGRVLGTALAIKMVAYVGLSPLMQAVITRLPRKAVLVALDLVRAAVALMLPFIDAVWQIYVLIFVLQAASAGFTPLFQATIPEILKDEDTYTRALSLSRLAYDLESLLSPLLAAALLTVMPFSSLFAGTAAGFAVSAVLVLGTRLPPPAQTARRGVWERTTRGIRLYLATPRLRGLLAANLSIAAAGAMVIVNTVVIVQTGFGMDQSAVAIAFAAFGGGSMLAALLLPRFLSTHRDRPVILTGAALLAVGTALGPLALSFALLAILWLVIGFGYGLALTPAGRLLNRSAHPEDRPAIFAAQFALSHACWLITYPAAGWLGPVLGMNATFLVLAAMAALGAVLAWRLLPVDDGQDVVHQHPDLPPDHPHLRAYTDARTHSHHHPIIIDDLHRDWPRAM